MNLLVIILAILPIFLIFTYFYKKDTQKEPKKLLQKLFLSGFLSAILTIAVTFIIFIIFPEYINIENANLFKVFIYSFIFVASIEEVCKWLMIYKVSYNHKEFDQFYDIVLYSVLVSLGFACFENLLYVIENDNGLLIAVFRSITAVPAHACFGTFMGYYLSLSKFKEKQNKNKHFILSLLIPIILHGTYDFFLLSGNIILVCTFLIFIVSMFIFTILKIKKTIKIDEEILKNNNCPNCNVLIKYKFCPNCGYKK